jgi:hypothetical protein
MDLKKPHDTSASNVDVPDGIWTEHFPITN